MVTDDSTHLVANEGKQPVIQGEEQSPLGCKQGGEILGETGAWMFGSDHKHVGLAKAAKQHVRNLTRK